MPEDRVYGLLERIVGTGNVSNEPYTLECYARDSTTNPPSQPDYVVVATTVEQIQGLVRLANKEAVPVVPVVGMSSTGGLTIPVEGGIILDLHKMDRIKVTVAVRGSPVINDATMVDARAAGITERVDVIDNGSDAPGTILHECSEAFMKRFNKADLIIAKGQGNYETLSEVEKDIFFVLKAKCPVIARDLGCQIDSLVLRRSTHVVTAAK